tara:strand:+ start:4313 stop:4999 length:687 start_codon:yes stop_codon:yes gene_type:complete
MRLKIKLKKTNKELPINNQHIVAGYVHNLLGRDNEYHNSVSNYCISTVIGKLNKKTSSLMFSDNPCFYVTSEDAKFLNKIITQAFSNKHKFYDGFEFEDFEFVHELFNNKFNRFNTLTPVLLKDDNDKEVTIKDKGYDKILVNNTIKKLSNYNPKLDLSKFDMEIKHINKKYIPLKNGKAPCNASVIMVDVKANQEVAETLYNIGLGKSTGYGFGTLYKNENYKKYFK